MLADDFGTGPEPREFLPIGRLDRDALPRLSRDAILDVIEACLDDLASRPEFRSIRNEKGITNRLCKILNCHKLLYFHHEAMQDERTGASPSVDIEAVATTATVFEARLYAKEETLMAVEAKRLPSPPPPSREREYLVGSDKSSGGVERFKLGIHGKNASAWTMIAYLQRHDFSSWHGRINGWLEDLARNGHPPAQWSRDEGLEVVATGAKTARYRSRNTRTRGRDTELIEITHLWVLLS
jgi:hypothetical protein